MYFHDTKLRASKNPLPGMSIRTFWGEKLLLALVDLEANTILPAHSHPHEQISYILEGELEFEIAGEKRVLKAGDIAVIPGGVEHSVIVGSSPVKVLDTFSPTREDFKYSKEGRG